MKSISSIATPQRAKEKPEEDKESNSNMYSVPKLYNLDTESKFINKNLTTVGRIFGILSNRKL